jgi:hypothetical protein
MLRLTADQSDAYWEALAQAQAPCIPVVGTSPPSIQLYAFDLAVVVTTHFDVVSWSPELLLRGLSGGHTSWYDELLPADEVFFATWRRRRQHLALVSYVSLSLCPSLPPWFTS